MFVCAATLAQGALAAEGIKIMTYNVRYASERGRNSWPDRRPIMEECIEQVDPDIIGTQEGLYHQLKDIERDLEDYEWIGLGREGGSKGEFMAIYYKPERFEPLEYDHFWLSDTPEVIGSASWGNTVRRMVTWVRFLDKESERQFYLVNTHFDHQVQASREKSAELLRQRIEKFDPDLPVIVTGDFNAKAGANKTYDILVEDGFLKDTWTEAKERRGEVVATFTGFGPIRREDNRIDWILGRGITTEWTEIITCQKDGQWPSDHFPVVAMVRLE